MARAYHRSVTTPAAARMSRAAVRPFVSLLTDFGDRDPSAGICRAVIAGIAPDATIVDISHEVEKYAVRDAALLLWCAVPYLPIGAHVAVVDPGVGTERRAIAIETSRGDLLVGPDNGILIPAASRLGGVVRAHLLENPQYRLPVMSSSFHGRDVFAPAAAHLALGVPLEFMGPALDPRTLLLVDWPEPEVYGGLLRSSVIYLDTFGNAKLSALGGHLLNAFGGLQPGEWLYVRLEEGDRPRDLRIPWVGTFGQVPVGQPLLYEDSYGRLCLAVNRGSAARDLGIRQDVPLTLTRAPLQALPANPPASARDPGAGRPPDFVRSAVFSPREVAPEPGEQGAGRPSDLPAPTAPQPEPVPGGPPPEPAPAAPPPEPVPEPWGRIEPVPALNSSPGVPQQPDAAHDSLGRDEPVPGFEPGAPELVLRPEPPAGAPDAPAGTPLEPAREQE